MSARRSAFGSFVQGVKVNPNSWATVATSRARFHTKTPRTTKLATDQATIAPPTHQIKLPPGMAQMLSVVHVCDKITGVVLPPGEPGQAPEPTPVVEDRTNSQANYSVASKALPPACKGFTKLRDRAARTHLV